MLKLMYRTIGLTFYQQHAGLFLVIFYLLFGAVEGSQLLSYHKALLMAICASPLVLLLVFGIWFLYALKCAFYVKQQLKLATYGFARNLNVLSYPKQLSIWAKVYALLLLPILCYSVFLLLLSFRHGFYFTFLAVVIQLVVMLFLLSLYTFRVHNYAFKAQKNWLHIPVLAVKRPFWTWPLFYLINEQRIMLLLCKVVSFVFLKGMLWMFADVGADSRVYLTATMAVVLSHAVLLLNLVKFEARYLSFAKGLPIATFDKLGQWFGVVLVLGLPEMMILVKVTGFDWLQLGIVLLYLTSAMLCLVALVYWLKTDMDRYLKCLLFFFFINMWAILAGQYLCLSLAMLGLVLIVFLRKYPKIDLRELV